MYSPELLDLLSSASNIITAQPGGQELYLSSPADFVIYGGRAGGGKTYASLIDPLRFTDIPGFNHVIFRRQLTEIRQAGGLWDESYNIYPHFNARPNITELKWTFPSGATVEFAGIANESDVYMWKGAQICGLGFDEITGITKKQFDYLVTRNRSICGVPPFIKATCNPDPTHWIAKFVDWYLLDIGEPDAAKRGVVRYFCTPEGWSEYALGDSVEYLCEAYGVEPQHCMSYTFIYATLDDNPALLAKDPNYATRLRSDPIEYARLAKGNWKTVRSGNIFKADEFQSFFVVPSDPMRKIIILDTASKTKERNDYSVGQCWVRAKKGIYKIDQFRGKFEINQLAMMVRSFIHKHKHSAGGPLHGVYVEDKSSGTQIYQIIREEALAPIYAIQRNKDKYSRAYDAQGWVQSGYVYLNPADDSYTEFMQEVVSFKGDGKGHDDQVDPMLDAIRLLLIDLKTDAISNSTLDFNIGFKRR